ncbi:hypothetical protein PTSG_10706 [Salpingoeca rosetta]|uniref:Major facilitator superfamily (MFS) profile domain-containing protein n=1 Tax=Salpingoeca rosetta (strain ATCC 50818 / BSB-021) TaxID=946362 RepID=F2UQ54_SALR5|nr:uncharacterized protein PTSG_10706 [Salpingoeca rosetta]EGD79722.1 hypothetical protein PTSG_10706 [Salpingoeca rosetta]|eukprot:XP_004988671.1 hypothetical protein PTSG_10706 [Salpingoeca rosetta]
MTRSRPRRLAELHRMNINTVIMEDSSSSSSSSRSSADEGDDGSSLLLLSSGASSLSSVLSGASEGGVRGTTQRSNKWTRAVGGSDDGGGNGGKDLWGDGELDDGRSSCDSDNEEARTRLDEQSRHSIDARVLPVAWLVQFTATLEVGNLANVNTQLGQDLGISQQRLAVAITIFYAAAIVLAIPSNLMLRAVKTKVWLGVLTMLSGVAMACINFVTTDTQVIVARAALGVVSAGIAPGILYVLIKWYKRGERSVRIALLISATTMAAAFGGLVADGCLHISGSLASWRYFFLIEGALIFAVGVLAYLLLPRPLFPSRDIAFHPNTRIEAWTSCSCGETIDTLTDATVWLFAIVFYSVSGVLYLKLRLDSRTSAKREEQQALLRDPRTADTTDNPTFLASFGTMASTAAASS